jgi:hypothetical protein
MNFKARRTLLFLGIVGGLVCVLSTAASNAETSRLDRIYAATRALQPRLSDAQAHRMASAFDQAQCSIAWQVTLSVAFQESSLNIKAVNRKSGDYGLMQVNEANVRRYGLSRKRLMADERYAIEAGCAILESVKGACPYWIGLYRTGPAVRHPFYIQLAKSYHSLVMKRAMRLGYRR